MKGRKLIKDGMNNKKESEGTELGDQWGCVGMDDGIVGLQTFHQGLGLGFNLCVVPLPVKLRGPRICRRQDGVWTECWRFVLVRIY